jgi:hypothetical protein
LPGAAASREKSSCPDELEASDSAFTLSSAANISRVCTAISRLPTADISNVTAAQHAMIHCFRPKRIIHSSLGRETRISTFQLVARPYILVHANRDIAGSGEISILQLA